METTTSVFDQLLSRPSDVIDKIFSSLPQSNWREDWGVAKILSEWDDVQIEKVIHFYFSNVRSHF